MSISPILTSPPRCILRPNIHNSVVNAGTSASLLTILSPSIHPPQLGSHCLVLLEKRLQVGLPGREIGVQLVVPVLGTLRQLLQEPGVLENLVQADAVLELRHQDLAEQVREARREDGPLGEAVLRTAPRTWRASTLGRMTVSDCPLYGLHW